jgi:KDO2-lipid IV(A) lauroyltransferase
MSSLSISAVMAAGWCLGRLVAALPIPRLRVVMDNLEMVYGSERNREEIKALRRNIFVHFGRMIFEIPRILRLSDSNLSQFFVFEGLDNLKRMEADGKGGFFLTAHFGNWELLNAAASILLKGNTAIVARPLDFPPLERLFSELRGLFGTRIIPKRKAMRQILRCSKEGIPVGILLDQNVDWYEGVFVPFLGRPACANKALALLALRTGAPVIPAFTIRMPDGRYRLVFEEPIAIVRTGDETWDIEENTRIFTQTIDRYVKRYPDHWFWFHRRWKTRPYCPWTPYSD